jgi:succinyl-CoA:acetate CoA-transferase
MERLSFMYQDRIRCAELRAKITSAAEAALLIQDGMCVGASGFTRAGRCQSRSALRWLHAPPGRQAVQDHVDHRRVARARCRPHAHRSARAGSPLAVSGRHRRLRDAINRGEVMFVDQHSVRDGRACCARTSSANSTIAIVEATAITETAASCRPRRSAIRRASRSSPTRSLSRSISAQPLALEGLHDIYIPRQATVARAVADRLVRIDRVGTHTCRSRSARQDRGDRHHRGWHDSSSTVCRRMPIPRRLQVI